MREMDTTAYVTVIVLTIGLIWLIIEMIAPNINAWILKRLFNWLLWTVILVVCGVSLVAIYGVLSGAPPIIIAALIVAWAITANSRSAN
ncbi:hypothetical protein G6321_00019210 [Bradyrhizobium barranii subsp. barranii]|uniref:Uncharacterized protein n=1 Tax=Bradyrhizobium barranii subsp. barranii TaxID=2823807 RepID=A0A7Z0QMF8_9BRAD|nr:hypothetical protein [Bradyrhizobium barranii]UGX97140.1 hypothetical protein G6321_00019210 [Bradyrhizobium barranii subsp. barranii]